MPVFYVEIEGPIGRDWQPPAAQAPPNFTATPGTTQVVLAWGASPTAGVTDYRVQYKTNAATTWTTFADGVSTSLTATVTGLTNGTVYNFRVAAMVGTAVGGYTLPVSATPTAIVTPPPPVQTTIFGFNTAEDAPLSEYLAKWNNRAPMVRRYSGNSFNMNGGQFQFTTAIAPEKRICYSVKNNDTGPYTLDGLGAGNGNAIITDWAESIPPNWHVALVPWHEPNDDIRTGNMTVSQFRNLFSQFRTAIDNATLQPGVRLDLVSNFMAYRVRDTPTYFDDSWVPPEADIMSIDIYSNPGHFTTLVLAPECSFSEGAEYGASFPDIKTRFRDSLEAIVRNGYKDRWAVLEHNAPPRNWDGPANPDYVCGTNKRRRYQGGKTATGHDSSHTEVERAAHLKGSVDYGLSRPTILGQQMSLPEFWLFWQHPAGVNWNQKFYSAHLWDTLKPYIIGTPVGGGTA